MESKEILPEKDRILEPETWGKETLEVRYHKALKAAESELQEMAEVEADNEVLREREMELEVGIEQIVEDLEIISVDLNNYLDTVTEQIKLKLKTVDKLTRKLKDLEVGL